jgi:hypothetical protein
MLLHIPFVNSLVHLRQNPSNLPSFEQHLGERPTLFPKYFLVLPTLFLVVGAQSCDGAYISKGEKNNQEQKNGKQMIKQKLPKLSSFWWIIVKLWLF